MQKQVMHSDWLKLVTCLVVANQNRRRHNYSQKFKYYKQVGRASIPYVSLIALPKNWLTYKISAGVKYFQSILAKLRYCKICLRHWLLFISIIFLSLTKLRKDDLTKFLLFLLPLSSVSKVILWFRFEHSFSFFVKFYNNLSCVHLA